MFIRSWLQQHLILLFNTFVAFFLFIWLNFFSKSFDAFVWNVFWVKSLQWTKYSWGYENGGKWWKKISHNLEDKMLSNVITPFFAQRDEDERKFRKKFHLRKAKSTCNWEIIRKSEYLESFYLSFLNKKFFISLLLFTILSHSENINKNVRAHPF